jgi:serine/threonine-protein phosphatase 2A regulatory subunit B'
VSAEASDASLRAGHFGGAPERHSLIDHGGATPPRATTLNRLRAGPRDTIPMVGKPPRKQRSSRFVVTEKVDIERLPPFMGNFGQRYADLFSLLSLNFRNSPK